MSTTSSWPSWPTAAQQVRTGWDPADEDLLYGPINNANQLRHVAGLVERAPDHARVVAGGARVGDRGYFYQATVVADLEQSDELIQTEVFGPGDHRAAVHRRR